MSVAGLERMTTASVAKRLTLSRHTGLRNIGGIDKFSGRVEIFFGGGGGGD